MACIIIKRKLPALIITGIVVFLFVSSSALGFIYSLNETTSTNNVISNICGQTEIPPGSDYYIKFNSQNSQLEKEDILPVSMGLSDLELQAVGKSPTWIQRKLIQQFQEINNTEDYAQLLLECDLQFTDEIAFTIANSPLGNVPPVEVLEENTRILYQIDPYIGYADIVDYDEGNGNYYSTLRYWSLENNTPIQYEYPREIYYWYVVHPRINREEPLLVYDRTWRNYLFYHNDVGHPLIQENVDNVPFLWDGKSHTQDTGIRAIQHWIGNNIRYQIIGDRPLQPNLIAHEHTGYCGETQKLAVAAFRTALIPMNGIMNYAEDHVWEEFYERGWYHYDGAIDNPYMYTDGWGKDMSSIWAWNGDGSIYEVTSTYLHPEDRIIVEFTITDVYGNPVDGAIVTVFVKGLKDITWHKDYVLDIMATFWEKIPDILKIRLVETIYRTIREKITDIEEVIETYVVTIWNHSDPTGRCTLELGKDDSYLFLIQKPDQRSIWPFYRFPCIRTLTETQDISYNIRFNDFSNPQPNLKDRNEIQGDYQGHLKLDLGAYQLQRNILTTDIGTYTFEGILDFFIVDEDNFERYQQGKRFEYYYYQKTTDGEIDFQLDTQDYYLIFRNPAHMTTVLMDYEISMTASKDTDTITITTPTTELFETPLFTIGTAIELSGITPTRQLTLTIGDDISKTLTSQGNTWSYQWETQHSNPGIYLVSAVSGQTRDTIFLRLIDAIPPTVDIVSPASMDLFEDDVVTIRGRAQDNFKLQKIEVAINDKTPLVLDGTEEWSYTRDMTQLMPGEHLIQVTAFDHSGLTTQEEITLVRNDSNNDWAPSINSLFHTPEHPTNTSTIRLYSNVTSDSPFSLKHVIVYYDSGSGLITEEMFRYGDYPPQERHVEDDIQNIPNDPIYGVDIGRFQTYENVTYWVEATDTAGNTITSEVSSFIIQ